MKEVLDRIEEIKRVYGHHPQCYLVAILLATEFRGEIWYDHDHCITRIEDKFYDRHGIYEGSLKKYQPLSNYGIASENKLIIAMSEWIYELVNV